MSRDPEQPDRPTAPDPGEDPEAPTSTGPDPEHTGDDAERARGNRPTGADDVGA